MSTDASALEALVFDLLARTEGSAFSVRAAPLRAALSTRVESALDRAVWGMLGVLMNLTESRTGLAPIAWLALAIYETGWDDAARVAKGTRNFGNIRGAWSPNAYQQAVALLPELARLHPAPPGGNMVSPSGQFRAYRGPVEWWADNARLMRTDRYAAVTRQTTPEAQIRAVQAGGYNDSETWVPRILSIMRTIQGAAPAR